MKARKCLPLLMFGQCGDSFGQLQPLVRFLNTFAVLPGVWGFGAACGPTHHHHRHSLRRHQRAGVTWEADRGITGTVTARSTIRFVGSGLRALPASGRSVQFGVCDGRTWLRVDPCAMPAAGFGGTPCLACASPSKPSHQCLRRVDGGGRWLELPIDFDFIHRAEPCPGVE